MTDHDSARPPKVLVIGTNLASPLSRSNSIDELLALLDEFGFLVTCQIHKPGKPKHKIKANAEVFFVRTKPFKRNRLNRALQRVFLGRSQRLVPKQILLYWFDKAFRVNLGKLQRGIRGVKPDLIIVCGPTALRGIESLKKRWTTCPPFSLLYIGQSRKNSQIGALEKKIIEYTYSPPLVILPRIERAAFRRSVRAALRTPYETSTTQRGTPRTLEPVSKDSPLHLLVAPANYAGQAYAWTQALKVHRPDITVSNIDIGDNPFGFAATRVVSADSMLFSPEYQRFIRSEASNWTHILLEAGRPFLGGQYGSKVTTNIDLLEQTNHKVGLIFHGTDIRDPDRHMERVASSYFREAPEGYVNSTRKRAAKNRELATRGLPCFVSTPDLLIDLPSASLLPVSIDVTKWISDRYYMQNHSVPTVFHRPSRSDPPIKGSEVIDPVLRDLDMQGLIHYLNPEQCTNDEMIQYVHESDIVVDQIRSGFYGVAAIEAMASRRLVIGYVDPETRSLSPEDPPIVDVSAKDFRQDMLSILGNLDAYKSTVDRGFEYAHTWHDGRAAAAVLTAFVSGHKAEDEHL